MTLGFLGNCLLQCLFIKMMSAQMPAKYIQMGNMAPMRPNVPSLPSVPMPYPTSSAISSLLNTYLPNYPNIPSIPNLSNIPIPPSMLPTLPPTVNPLSYPSNLKLPGSATSYFDPTVMNNLAIALHLLILTNLLHPEENPKANLPCHPTESQPQNPVTIPAQNQVAYPQNQPANPYPQHQPANPYPQNTPNPTYQQPNVVQGYYATEPQEPPPTQPFAPPNSQFLSSSGFVEPSIPPSLLGAPSYNPTSLPPSLPSRNSYSLMSPYEALGPGPQTKDVFAQYGPQNFKADFQSPYNSIMANDNASKDLFNMF